MNRDSAAIVWWNTFVGTSSRLAAATSARPVVGSSASTALPGLACPASPLWTTILANAHAASSWGWGEPVSILFTVKLMTVVELGDFSRLQGRRVGPKVFVLQCVNGVDSFNWVQLEQL
jgi:hypothetical protein